jgi:hypothetical protein
MEDIELSEKKGGGRGAETLFRVTYQNQIGLIRIADNKAHLIISINSVIITVILALTGLRRGYLDTAELQNFRIMVPVTVILLTSLLSVTFAIRAAMPHVRKPKKDKKTQEQDRASLLFFATISSRTMNDYMAEMKQLLKSKPSIHENMIIDIYNQAKVLNIKYSFLNIAYQIFMYGFIAGVLTFFLLVFIIP